MYFYTSIDEHETEVTILTEPLEKIVHKKIKVKVTSHLLSDGEIVKYCSVEEENLIIRRVYRMFSMRTVNSLYDCSSSSWVQIYNPKVKCGEVKTVFRVSM